MTQTLALSCENVKVMHRGKSVLRDVNLEIVRGKWLTLVGRNGAGKTSLLRSIAGLAAFTGEVRVGFGETGDTTSVVTLGVRERALAMAYVPQRPTVPTGMTVTEYVMLGRAAHIPLFGVERDVDVAVMSSVLDRLAVKRFASRRVEELSGGEWQRVVLARALAQESPLLLLDEPTTSLDIGHQQDVLELIEELRSVNGLTVLSTMHELTLAGQYADEVALIDCEGIVARGAASEVLTEDLISRHYGASVRVKTVDGLLTMVPIRRSVVDG